MFVQASSAAQNLQPDCLTHDLPSLGLNPEPNLGPNRTLMISTTDPHINRQPRNVSNEEWAARVQLAAAYRMAAKFGMTDLIYTHLSTRVPGSHDQFLINPHGWFFDEITASSLVKIDTMGRPLDDARFEVNAAGFTIHSALHQSREDVECVVHLHTDAGMAVAALAEGLMPLNQISMQFYNRVAYHDYEGISLDLDERARIVQSLGDKHFLILRNHGLLTVGRSVAEAFTRMFYLNRACEIQVKTLSMGRELVMPSPAVCEHAAKQHDDYAYLDTVHLDREWTALLRLVDRDGQDYIR